MKLMIPLLSTLASANITPLVSNWTLFNSSLVLEVTKPSGVYTCSGVAIKSNQVLTAAHCLDGALKIKVSYYSKLQDTNIIFYEAKSWKMHPDYDPKSSLYLHDIGKITLKDHLPKDLPYHPIYTFNDYSGDILRFGYGLRGNKNIRTVTNPSLYQTPQSSTLVLTDQYSFNGDSGGPVFIQKNNQTYLVALHSTLDFGPHGAWSYNPVVSEYAHWFDTP